MSLRMSILILNMQYRLYIDYLRNDSQLYSRFFRAFSVLDLFRKIVILRNKTPCFCPESAYFSLLCLATLLFSDNFSERFLMLMTSISPFLVLKIAQSVLCIDNHCIALYRVCFSHI